MVMEIYDWLYNIDYDSKNYRLFQMMSHQIVDFVIGAVVCPRGECLIYRVLNAKFYRSIN